MRCINSVADYTALEVGHFPFYNIFHSNMLRQNGRKNPKQANRTVSLAQQ
jgi:hypothetical protein